jgi:hypothetical protein
MVLPSCNVCTGFCKSALPARHGARSSAASAASALETALAEVQALSGTLAQRGARGEIERMLRHSAHSEREHAPMP